MLTSRNAVWYNNRVGGPVTACFVCKILFAQNRGEDWQMELRRVNIDESSALGKKVKALYIESFPKEERIPWPLLRMNALRKGIDLCAWMDGTVFCGLTASVAVEGMYLLLFFAVVPGKQSKGYGSAILAALRREYPCICLNIELLDPAAENYPQRQRRFVFYKRNGFFDTRYHVWEVGGKFRVFSTDEILDTARYKKAFKKLTFGLWDVRLEKE